MGSCGEEERSFRFNNIDFSDQVLRLEITPAMPSNSSEVSNSSESVATDLKIKKIHIISLLLAYKSQFFYKLFKNGMKETQQRDEVALRINESDEAGFMDLLKFIYDHSVDASSAPDLVGVLMAADKFEVPSCVDYCVEMLLKLPMSTELALVYLELPSSLLATVVVQTLIDSAKSYICAHYRDFTKSQEKAMGLPLCAVEIFIANNGLQVDSEDVVFDFVLKWGRLHYPELEERREILTRLLVNFVCLPNLTSSKLKEILDCSDLDSGRVWKPVMDALFSKVEDTKYEHPRRVYNRKFVKVQVVQLQLAHPLCVVYFDLTKKECADLVPLKPLYSHTFCLDGRQKMSLFAECKQGKRAIGLFVHPVGGSQTCTLDFYVSVLEKSSKEFRSVAKDNNIVFRRDKPQGFVDLFDMSWAAFMSEDSEYFIDGVLHLRADITLLSRHGNGTGTGRGELSPSPSPFRIPVPVPAPVPAFFRKNVPVPAPAPPPPPVGESPSPFPRRFVW